MKCSLCIHCKCTHTAKTNGNNRMLKGPRSGFKCIHPKAEASFKKYSSGNYSSCFIGFSKPGENRPSIKSKPRWCPLLYTHEFST